MAEHFNEKFGRTSNIQSIRIDKDGAHITADPRFFFQVELGTFGASLPRGKGSLMESSIPPKFADRTDNIEKALAHIIDRAQQKPSYPIPAQFVAEAAKQEGLVLDVPGPGRSPF